MAKEIKVLAISYGRNLFDANNAERQRMELCARTVAEHHMIVFTKRSDNVSVIHAPDGLVLHPTNSKTRFHMIPDAIWIGSALLAGKSGRWVISTQDPFEAGLVGYILARRFMVKLNVQEHGDFFSTHFWKKESFFNHARFYFGKWLLRRADTVRVVSSRMEATMERIGVNPDKILRLAVRTDAHNPSDKDGSVDLHTHYPEASVIVLSLARFVPQKNLSLLITAFGQLHTLDPKALLVLVGSGAEEQKLRDMVKQQKLEASVIFKPWTDTPQAYMRSADIYALSSNYEGWGRVLVEAMLAGTPVVTTDVGCAGEILTDAVHGFVVPVDDVQEFAMKLQLLATDKELRTQFSQSARADIVATHCSPEVYAEAWADIIKQTLHNHN